MQRKLNEYESFLWLLGREEPFLIQWTLMVAGEMQPRAVAAALKLLQNQHPLLNTTVTLEAPFEYKPIHKNISLRIHERIDQASWEQPALKALNHRLPLTEEETFLVVDWVKGKGCHEFILTMDHAFSDLRCLTGLGCDFLKFLDQTLAGVKDIKIKYYPQLPPIHALLPLEKPPAPPADLSVPFTDPETPLLANPPYHYKLPYVLKLSSHHTQQLLEAVRKHHCTVHSLFCAVMMHTLNDYLLENGHAGKSFCFTPADLRPYLNAEIDGKDLGNFAADVFHPFIVGALKPLWELAQSVKQQVEQAFATDAIEKAKQGIAALFQEGISVRDVVRGLKIRDACTAVGNVGIIPMPTEFKHFKVLNMQFGSASSIMSGRGRLFWLRIATLYGQLQLEFLRTCPREDLDIVPEFAQRVMATLQRYGIINSGLL